MSRYACYLIVKNAVLRKEVIAFGQTYFTIQTYHQEVADYFNELDEDNSKAGSKWIFLNRSDYATAFLRSNPASHGREPVNGLPDVAEDH